MKEYFIALYREIVRNLALGVIFGMLLLLLVLFAMLFASPVEDLTVSQDHFTIEQTADNETVTVLYEVSYERQTEASNANKRAALQSVSQASSCANEQYDSYLAGTNAGDVSIDELQSASEGCESEYVSVTVHKVE